MSNVGAGTVLVAGGGGYLGSVLCRLLLDGGVSVRVVDRLFFGNAPIADLAHREGFQLVRCDIRDLTAAHLAGVDTVIDLAGLSNDPACALDQTLTTDINVRGASILLTAARRSGVRRYVYQSSCSVYGAGGDSFLDEDSTRAPLTAYAESKATMEDRVLAEAGASFEPTVSRMGTLYGLSPRMRFDLIINIMTLIAVQKHEIFLLGGGNQWRPLIHVRDAARALVLLSRAPAEKVSGRVFNMGSTDHNYRVSRVARMVLDQVPGTTLITVPEDPDQRSYRVRFDRAKRELSFACELGPEDGIGEILNALQEETVPTGVTTRTVDYYRYLLDAKKALDEVTLNGRLL